MFSEPPATTNGSDDHVTPDPWTARDLGEAEMETILDGNDTEEVPEITLPGAPIPEGQVEEWQKIRNMGFVMDPVLARGIAWFDAKPGQDGHATQEDRTLYPTTTRVGDEWSESYRDFVTEAFATTLSPQAAEDLTQRFADFLESIKQYRQKIREDVDTFEAEPLDDAYSIALCIYAVYFRNGASGQSGFFASQQTYEVRRPLVEWVNVSEQQPSVALGEEVMSQTPPVQHNLFWRYIYQLVCRGMLTQASHCLRESGAGEVDPSCQEVMEQTVDILSKYPHGPGNVSFYFRQWHNSIAAVQSKLLKINDAKIQRGLVTLLQVLAGDEDAIMSVNNTWYDALVTLQQYVDPCDVLMKGYYVDAVANHPVDTFTTWEAGASHAIKGSLLLAIETLENCDTVIAALVCNMCYDAGLLGGYGAANPAALPDYHLTNLALQCIGYDKLINVGIEVLLKVRDVVKVRQILTLLLPRLPYDSPLEIDWVLKTCKQNGLVEVEAEVLQTLAQKAFYDNNNLMGLCMFAKIGNIAALRYHCWKLFENALVAEKPVEEDKGLAVYVKDPASVSDVPAEVAECIAPYAVLTEYFNLRRSGELVKSSQYLMALFEFPLMPTKYLGLLIHQLINYVSPISQQFNFSTAQFMTLLAAFSKWSKAQGTPAFERGQELMSEMVERQDPDDWRRTFQINELIMSELRLARTSVATMSSLNGLGGLQ